MNNSKHKWILTVQCLLFISIVHFSFDTNLHLTNITSTIPYRAEWAIKPLEEPDISKVTEILQQPFSYLNEGGQAYAFASADQKYVLKLFKFKRFRPSLSVSLLPPIFPFKAYRERHITKRYNKLLTAFNSYKIAYESLRQESGLIFVQLNYAHAPQIITLIDKSKRKISVDLANISYILQEKGEMFSHVLTRILNRGDRQVAQQRISQLFDLYLSEYNKGIYDLDLGVVHNIGFIEDKIFHLDAGKLIHDERIKDGEFREKKINRNSYDDTRVVEQTLSALFCRTSLVYGREVI